PYTMNEIVSTVADVLEQDFGMPVKRGAIHLPAIASDIAFVADSALQAVGLYHSKIHVLSEMARTIACSTAKAEHEIGYRRAAPACGNWSISRRARSSASRSTIR